MKYTPNQKRAIRGHFPGNLLISASAGSGKTMVLINRVIHRLLNGGNVSHLLLVTFTRTAAKEMRDRIRRALHQQLNRPGISEALTHHLLSQLRQLPIANISTLDAFCQQVVSRYYYVIGLDPHFRVLTDSSEVTLLRDLVWQRVREDFYANDHQRFTALVQNFSHRSVSDDSLTALVYRLYDYANVNVSPKHWLTSRPALYRISGPLTDSNFYQKHLLKLLRLRFDQVQLNLRNAYRLSKRYSLKKESRFLKREVSGFSQLLQKLGHESWDNLRSDFKGFKFGRFPPGSKSAHQAVKAERNLGKKRYYRIVGKYFALNEARNQNLLKRSFRLVSELVKVVRSFAREYRAAKAQRHAMEFIDIEHAALRILRDDSQEGRAVRNNLRSHFDEIMVDEYQDNNHLQDRILTTVAKHRTVHGQSVPVNIFMVGDVKQSIYRFRLADPHMFTEKIKTYNQKGSPNCLLRIADNFRSTRNIDQFVNLIFSQVMDRQIGGIDYSAEKLRVGIRYPSAIQKLPVELLIYESHPKLPKDFNEDQSDDQFRVSDGAHGQIEIVAQKIDQLIRTGAKIYDRHLHRCRPVQYRDIAIIASTRNNNLVISDVFRQHRIPVTINGLQSYFKTTEIQIMMSLLEVIDNPDQDIPLVAVLRSPMVDLDENQLASLRIRSRSGSYYRVVRQFDRGYHGSHSPLIRNLYRKLHRFLVQLNYFQNVARQHGIVDLIWTIYQTTGFLDYVGGMPAGDKRQANLHALYERAADYEKTSFRGLFRFIYFVKQMQSQQEDLTEAQPASNSDTVSVMTIHGSKGLEFPVVFLIDVSHGFNRQDVRQSYVINDHLGIGIHYFEPHQRVTFDTLPDLLIRSEEQDQSQAEEMRKLYVALTRAEQRLFIVGTTPRKRKLSNRKDLIKKWLDLASGNDLLLNAGTRGQAKNYLAWLGPALVRHPEFVSQFENVKANSNSVLAHDSTRFKVEFLNRYDLVNRYNRNSQLMVLPHRTRAPKLFSKKLIKRVMQAKYPHQLATERVNYQSVSEIKGRFADPDDEQMGSNNGRIVSPYATDDFARPKFMQKATHPKATEVGTATHLVLQMIDLTKLAGLNKASLMHLEIKRTIKLLVERNLIDQPVARKINSANILAFFLSSFGQAVLRHPSDYHRERPFSLLIRASQIYKGFPPKAPEKILIHGIVDGFLDSGGQIDLVDYKTDYVDVNHPKLEIQKIADRYRGQLNLYKIALENALHRPVKHRYLYLLNIQKLLPMG